MAQGSDTLKRVFLELGGKSANIILDDADFPAQMGSGAMVCMHGGQGCAITTRMLVPRSRYDEAVDLLQAGFESWSYGDPTDPANLQGPLINARQRERVLGLIEKGKSEGCAPRRWWRAAGAVREGLLRRADAVRRRRPRLDDRAGGDLRPGALGDPVRGRRRRGAHREQLALRPLGRGQRHGPRPRVRHREAAAHRDGGGQRWAVVRPGLAVRWLQGVRPRPRARHRRASRSTSRPRRSACRPGISRARSARPASARPVWSR